MMLVAFDEGIHVLAQCTSPVVKHHVYRWWQWCISKDIRYADG